MYTGFIEMTIADHEQPEECSVRKAGLPPLFKTSNLSHIGNERGQARLPDPETPNWPF